MPRLDKSRVIADLELAKDKIASSTTIAELESVRVELLGKKGSLVSYAKEIKDLPPEQKRIVGSVINEGKNDILRLISERHTVLEEQALNTRLNQERIDVTLPARESREGSIHPITKTTYEILEFFTNQGFEIKEGPEIEEDYYNFTALNIPENHPARKMQDSFYLEGNKLLRTHTSPVQIRAMLNGRPPFKIVSFGRVFRNDSDLTHTPMFSQVEGLYIDEGVNMCNLKHCLTNFLQYFFNIDDLPIRFRPSFFPFTEPSAEVDIGCIHSDNELKIDALGKNWLEILGCGMVHPQVLKNVGVDSGKYRGFAFGLGIERMAMLKYGINDLRQFFLGDMRWLEHYGFHCFGD